jgi:NAD(P)-dependent dehydrogenase (short-subunit alcohol dehydrogenase family)
MELKPINEQVVVLMGASSGIGRLSALRFAERGAKVVVAARSEEDLRSLVDEIRGKGGEATAVVADVTDFDGVKAAADRAAEEYGRLDTWVHLAGVLLVAGFEETDLEEFERVIHVNLMGQVYGARAALPHLRREGRGALIHVSSMAAKRSVPLQSAYSASKHGIDGFLESLRVELRHEGLPVSVTQVMPATINTPLFDKARTKLGVKPVAPPPIYEPGAVADAILHAAENPERDLVVGAAARALITSQQISPQTVDAFMETFGFEVHYTDEPKSADDSNNLFEPVEGQGTVEGTFSEQAILARSYDARSGLPPAARWIAEANTALGILAVLQANGTLLELAAEQAQEGQQAFQKLLEDSLSAHLETLNTPIPQGSPQDPPQRRFEQLLQHWMEQTQEQQQTFQRLVQESMNSYIKLLNIPLSYTAGHRMPTDEKR